MTEGHITPLCIDSEINLEKDHYGAVENIGKEEPVFEF